jgi:dTDP-4-amino-4,6-dideoxygalactose transaminase
MKLAINGGPKTITTSLPPHPVVGEEERAAVDRVFDRNQFSQFIASAGKNFLGGLEVQGFEQAVAESSNCKYGVAYNSWTSGLHAAVAACNVKFGDAVFCTPYSFTSSATCALMNNCVPVFVDVDPVTCNISPQTLTEAIKRNNYIKVLVLVHLFGLPADMDGIMKICRERGIKVIEDCAQAPGAKFGGRPVGSIGDCGGFSFTQSKTVMCGEGGVLVTNDEEIATRAQMVRNHGEAIEGLANNRTYNSEILGMGYRITEIAAAIGTVQWGRLDAFNACRNELNEDFKAFISELCDFIDFQDGDYDHERVYYVTPMLFNQEKAGIHRDKFADAIAAEGVPIFKGCTRPLYMQTLYQEKNHHALRWRTDIDYHKGLCPNTEELYENKVFYMMSLRPPMTLDSPIYQQIKDTVKKVVDNLDELK